MEKAVFDKIVEKANGCPFIIYGDNMMLCNVGFEGNYFLQDDDNVYCIRVNKVAGANAGISQQASPYEVLVFNYAEIQYIKIFPNKETLENILGSAQPMLKDEKLEDIKKEIFTSQIMKASSPTGTGINYHEKLYGNILGTGVIMGKDVDPATKKAIEEYNNQKNNN